MIYAIDFGTSNSLLAAADERAVLPPVALDSSAPDPTVMRSVLYTPEMKKWYFGTKAIDAYGEQQAEGRIFRSIKKYLPESSFSGTAVHGRYFSLAELISVFLREMRERANKHFNQDVTSVVLGRPAAFSLDSKADKLAEDRLADAARLAGFKNVAFCPEPVAAAYEFRHQLTAEPKLVLIADFGGGTSDFTVLKMSQALFTDSDVLGLGGISLAGDRFDGAIMKHMIAPHFGSEVTYRMPTGSNDLRIPTHLVNRLCSPPDISFLAKSDIMNLLKDAQKWSLAPGEARKMDRLFVLIEEHLGYKLFRNIERTKIALSDYAENIFEFEHPGMEPIVEKIFGADFKAVSHELVERIVGTLDATLKAAGVLAKDVDIVVLTGGTAKLPSLNQELARRFGKEKLTQHRHFHSVVQGLAERAKMLIA